MNDLLRHRLIVWTSLAAILTAISLAVSVYLK